MELERSNIRSTGRAVDSATRRGMPVRTLQSQVVDQLGIAIVGGEFPPGATLPIDAALQERFGVSRTVLREALKALAAKNLLTSRARIGTVILPRREWSLFDPDVLAWHFEPARTSPFCAASPKSASASSSSPWRSPPNGAAMRSSR